MIKELCCEETYVILHIYEINIKEVAKCKEKIIILLNKKRYAHEHYNSYKRMLTTLHHEKIDKKTI